MNMKTQRSIMASLSLAVLLVLVCGAPRAAEPAKAKDPLTETKAERDARMAWWREAKFGMFIHWGVYAVPAGTYKDKRIDGIGEWIMLSAKIPVTEYKAFAKRFNPVKYDPDAWAALAKEAGMKYIVITSKHHDGFALFDSAVTDWDVMDATPYKKDLIAALATAARKQGLKFGCYYSQAQDWNHPGGAKAGYPDGGGWDDLHKGSFDAYLKKIAIPQVREVLTKIQPDILWWDTAVLMTPERAAPLHALIALKPGLITNNRLGGRYRGDTETPEQEIPDTGFKDRDWETCMTMNDTWGYKSYDQNWKSTQELIRNLADIVSKGGNYLLNVGPTSEGLIPEESVKRLKEVGAWMKVNGEAIYGTTASPFGKPAYGRITAKPGKLYVHVFDWPKDGKLELAGMESKVTKAYLLADPEKKALTVTTAAAAPQTVQIAVPAQAPDPNVSVIVLECGPAAQARPAAARSGGS
jgi:alpha-L-fucosidase